MRIEFFGTDQEFAQFKKKYKDLAANTTHMGQDLSTQELYQKNLDELYENIEEMKLMRNKFIHIMDKSLGYMSKENKDD